MGAGIDGLATDNFRPFFVLEFYDTLNFFFNLMYDVKNKLKNIILIYFQIKIKKNNFFKLKQKKLMILFLKTLQCYKRYLNSVQEDRWG